MTQAMTQGLHHLGLTVPNVQQSAQFFIEGLGFNNVGEKPEYPAIFVSDGTAMLTLWQAENPQTATEFNRKTNLGLHHFAFKVTDLDSSYKRLVKRGDVNIEFAPEALGTSSTKHMMIRIPGNIRMELIQA